MDNELGMKIWRVVYPPLIYIFVNIFVQAGLTLFVLSTFNSGGAMIDGVSAIERIDGKIQEYSILVSGISALITIGIIYRFIKQEFLSDLNKRLDKKYLILIPLGFFANTGLSRLVSLFSIESSSVNTNPVLEIITFVLLIPIMEEMVFRGMVYKRIKEYTGNLYMGVFISSLFFAVYHMNLLQGIYTFILGLILVYVYEKFGNIVAPIILHMVCNMVALLLKYSGISSFLSTYLIVYVLIMIIELAALVWLLRKVQGRNK